jgi:hypothetical protein
LGCVKQGRSGLGGLGLGGLGLGGLGLGLGLGGLGSSLFCFFCSSFGDELVDESLRNIKYNPKPSKAIATMIKPFLLLFIYNNKKKLFF